MSFFGNDSKTVFYRAFTISGHEAGLGADCPICGGRVRYGLVSGQTTFEHCGKKELAPTDIRDLDCRSLKRGLPMLPKSYQLLECFSTLENNDWERDSDAASFNPERMEIPWT